MKRIFLAAAFAVAMALNGQAVYADGGGDANALPNLPSVYEGDGSDSSVTIGHGNETSDVPSDQGSTDSGDSGSVDAGGDSAE